MGCRWYTVSDENKGPGQGQGQGQGKDKGHDEYKDKDKDKGDHDSASGPVDDTNDNGHDNNDVDEGDVVSDMDTLLTLYNIANLLQLQGISLPYFNPILLHTQSNTQNAIIKKLIHN